MANLHITYGDSEKDYPEGIAELETAGKLMTRDLTINSGSTS